MLHDVRLRPPAKHRGPYKDTVRHARPLHGVADRGSHQLARAWMGRMRLHHDRASGRESRRRIAARHRERKGEVRRAEHANRTERMEHPAQIGAGSGLRSAARGRSSPRPRIPLRSISEEVQLAYGPPPLAFDPRHGERRRMHPLDERPPRPTNTCADGSRNDARRLGSRAL